MASSNLRFFSVALYRRIQIAGSNLRLFNVALYRRIQIILLLLNNAMKETVCMVLIINKQIYLLRWS